MVWLLAACATVAPDPPATPPRGLTATACEKNALMTGQASDVISPESVAEDLRWGELAPETCSEAATRLDGGPASGRR